MPTWWKGFCAIALHTLFVCFVLVFLLGFAAFLILDAGEHEQMEVAAITYHHPAKNTPADAYVPNTISNDAVACITNTFFNAIRLSRLGGRVSAPRESHGRVRQE